MKFTAKFNRHFSSNCHPSRSRDEGEDAGESFLLRGGPAVEFTLTNSRSPAPQKQVFPIRYCVAATRGMTIHTHRLGRAHADRVCPQQIRRNDVL